MSKDAYYFPHDSNAASDPKIMLLTGEMGLEGYGIYWVLVEHLREQPDFRSMLKILKPLAMRHNSSDEKFMTVVSRYGLFERDENHFWSEALITRMQPYMAKQEAGRKAGLKSGQIRRLRAKTNEPSTNLKGTLNNKSKVNKSKRKKNTAGAPKTYPVLEAFSSFKTQYKELTGCEYSEVYEDKKHIRQILEALPEGRTIDEFTKAAFSDEWNRKHFSLKSAANSQLNKILRIMQKERKGVNIIT